MGGGGRSLRWGAGVGGAATSGGEGRAAGDEGGGGGAPEMMLLSTRRWRRECRRGGGGWEPGARGGKFFFGVLPGAPGGEKFFGGFFRGVKGGGGGWRGGGALELRWYGGAAGVGWVWGPRGARGGRGAFIEFWNRDEGVDESLGVPLIQIHVATQIQAGDAVGTGQKERPVARRLLRTGDTPTI